MVVHCGCALPRLALSLPSFCLSSPNVEITDMYHHAQFYAAVLRVTLKIVYLMVTLTSMENNKYVFSRTSIRLKVIMSYETKYLYYACNFPNFHVGE